MAYIRFPYTTVVYSDGTAWCAMPSDIFPDDRLQLVAAPAHIHPSRLPQFEGLVPVTIPFLESSIWLAARPGVLNVYDTPLISKSVGNGSGALYIAESADPMRGWWLQVLPPYVMTSRHHHREKIERFISLANPCKLGLSDGYDDFDLGKPVDVHPQTVHHLRASEEPALNLLIIRWANSNHEGVSPLVMEDHHFEAHPRWA